MARPLRLEFPGALYHVTARGNARIWKRCQEPFLYRRVVPPNVAILTADPNPDQLPPTRTHAPPQIGPNAAHVRTVLIKLGYPCWTIGVYPRDIPTPLRRQHFSTAVSSEARAWFATPDPGVPSAARLQELNVPFHFVGVKNLME